MNSMHALQQLLQAKSSALWSEEFQYIQSGFLPLKSMSICKWNLLLRRYLLLQTVLRDGSYSNGVVSTETIIFQSTSLGQTVSLPQIIIGCGQNNSGLFNEDGSGMIGLSRGSMSLISQMDSSIDGKFSYCLVPAFSQLNSSSKVSFGNNAVVSGATVVSTLLLSGMV